MSAASPASNPHEFDLDQHVFFCLTQVIGSRDRRLAQALKPFGLRVPEWRALAALHARGSCSMTELAELSSIDRTTLTRTIDRMQDARWLSRLADTTDMRVIRLALTKTGERLFAQVWPAVERLNRAAVEGLPAPAVDMLRWTLARMKSNLDLEPAEAERAA